MERHDRMIAAARRRARRIARRNESSYQQALDRVAVECGRRHWADYLADPAPVPRDEDDRERLLPVVMLSGRDWNMPMSHRVGWMRDVPFLPGWNGTSDEDVGGRVSFQTVERHMRAACGILIPDVANDRYFVDAGREALVSLVAIEIMRSRREGRKASLPSIVSWLAEGMERRRGPSAEERTGSALCGRVWTDATSRLIASLCDELVGECVGADLPWERFLVGIEPLIDMHPKERSGILGVVHQGMLPFRNPHVRSMTS